MAYYYFDSDDHIQSVHNADVYLLANVGNYHDYNGENPQIFKGFYLVGGKTFTVGGNYEGNTWNIYQKQSLNASLSNQIYAAVSFNGDGEFNISSQIGASDAEKHDDRNITINAYNFLTNDKASTRTPDAWNHYRGSEGAIGESFTVNGTNISLKIGENVNYNDKYNISGQVADINGIYAKNNLTVASNFNGYINVEGYHESIGMMFPPGSSDIYETANDTSTIAAGLRGDNTVNFNGSFFGSIKANVQVHFQTAKGNAINMKNNTIGAYGVFSQSAITQNNIHAGTIFSTANNNYLDATIPSTGGANGTLSNNTITAAGLRAENITINQLDASWNNTHASNKQIEQLDKDAIFSWSDLSINGTAATDMTDRINYAYVSDSYTGTSFYYIELPTGEFNTGERVAFTNGDITGYGTIQEIATYVKDSSGKYSIQKIDVILITQEYASAFYTFKMYNDGYVLDTDITAWTINNIVFTSADVNNTAAGQVIMNSTKPEDMTEDENLKYSTVTWRCENKLQDGCYILNINGEYIRIEASEVTFNGNRCSYTFTEDDADLYDKLNLTALEFDENTINGYYEFDYTTNSISFNQSGSYNSGKFNFVAEADTVRDFSIDFNINGTSDSKNGTLDRTDFDKLKEENQVRISAKDENAGLPELILYQYSTVENEDFNIYISLDKEVLIRSEANDNILKVTGYATNPGNNMTDNIVQAVGIYSKDVLNIKDFTAGSVIETFANDNEMWAQIGTGSITGNQINSIGLYGNTVNLNDFYGTIYVEGKNNFIDFPDNLSGTGIYTFAGIRATNLNVDRDLHGIITVNTAHNDTCHLVNKTSRNDQYGNHADYTSSSTHSDGIYADNMTVDGFIQSDITVNSYNGSLIASGIYVSGTLATKGFSGNITIDSTSISNVFGIYAKTFKSDLGYYYTFVGEDTKNDYEGSTPGTKKVVVALDTFTVEGSILVQGSLQQHGIATRDTANIYIDGFVMVTSDTSTITDLSLNNLYYMSYNPYNMDLSYAVKTDFGNDVVSGFHNDIVQLGENAIVFGIIAMGGGDNNLTFDDDSRFFGYVFHDNGKTNITYNLNGVQGKQPNDYFAIHTANNECDATLSSGTTITINCNNILEGEEYKIIEYVGTNAVKSLADTHWKTGAITISYMGESRLIYLNNYSGIGQIEGSNGESIYVKVNYDTQNHTLNVKALQAANTQNDAFATPETLAAINIETRIEDLLDAEGNVVYDANGNAVKVENEYITLKSFKTAEEEDAMLAAFEHHINYRNDNQVDYVTYTKDETTYSSTASTTLYWMCDIEDYRNSSYEIVYEILDAKGNSVSHALLRLNTVNADKEAFSGTIEVDGYKKTPVNGRIYLVNAEGKTFAEYQKEGYDPSTFIGAYYIMSYDIDSIPEGCTVSYKVRDYYGDGFEISEWIDASINTQKQEYPAFVNDINSKYMVAVNPDDGTRRVGSSIALFTWRAVESNYAVDYYNVQYFSSTEDLSGDDAKRQAIFDTYAKTAGTNIKDKWIENAGQYSKNGNIITFDIYFGNGEIQIREKISEVTLSDGSKETVYNYYNFVSKKVSGTELLVSGLSNQSYIYWQVNATDVLGTQNNYVEGGDFRIFLGDTEGPAFTDVAKLSLNKVFDYNTKEKEFTISDFTWGGIRAEDEKSGVRYYIIEASVKDKNQWTEVYHIDAHELENAIKFNFGIAPGIYDIRVRPVDAAGNYGTPSDKITIYAVDDVKPECMLTETKANAWIIGEGEYQQQLGWNYTFSFDPAIDPTSPENTFQSTGINEYVVDVYYNDANGAKTTVDWELWGLVNDPETGNLTYVRITSVTPKNNKFTPDAKYLGYMVKTGNMTYYQLDAAGNPIMDEESEYYLYNGRNYFVSIKVSDKFGNTTDIINKELNVSPEGGGGEGDSTSSSAPNGVFTNIAEAVVTATHKITTVTKPGTSGSESEGEEEDENTGTGDNTQQVIGKITDATVTLSWTDTFESPNDVYYLLQVSDDAFFNSSETYTVLIISSKLTENEAWSVYDNLAKKYQNLRLYSVLDSSSSSTENNSGTNSGTENTSTAKEQWRNGTGRYTTTVIFDNLQPTSAVGIFSNPGKTYWQIKAVDKFGNETDFEAVQDLNFVSNVTNEQIIENGTLNAVKDITVKSENNNFGTSVSGGKLYKNNGILDLSFTIDNTSTLLGYEHFSVEYYNIVTGEQGSIGLYAMHAENHGGSAYTKVNGDLNNFKDGDYVITVNAYDFNGNATTSEQYTFTQDTVAPIIPSTSVGTGSNRVNTTIKVAFDKPADNDPRILTTVSWPLGLDLYGIKGYVLSYRCKAINNEWQKVYVNGTDLLTTNSCQITLFNDQVYDFAIYAIDNNGNYSEEIIVENIIISYKDIDDADFQEFNPGYTPYGTGPISINNQLIGGGDLIDTIRVGTASPTAQNNPAGEMQITISNLQLITGYGPTIALDVYEENGGNILKNTYYFNIYNAGSATGLTVKHLLESSGNPYHFEIRSLDGSTLQYDLHYQFDWFVEDHSNDTAFALNYARDNEIHTVNFDKAQNDATYSYFVGGDDQYSNRVGYGDSDNYTRLIIETDGKYSFTLTKEGKDPQTPANVTQYCQDTLSAVTVTIYKATPGSTALTYVSSFTVAYYMFENTLKDLNLAKGEYVIRVNSASAAYGANVKYNLEISTSADKYYTEINNSDDIFTNAGSINVYPYKDAEGNEANYYFPFGELTNNNATIIGDYIGTGDSTDFCKIEVTEAGKYTFDLYKATGASDNLLQMTIYKKVEGATYLTAVNTVYVYAGTAGSTMSQYLDNGEYYLSVNAVYPGYTAVYYAVEMTKDVFGAEGSFSITDDDRFDITINSETKYTANDMIVENTSGLIYLNDAFVGNQQKIINKNKELEEANKVLADAELAVADIDKKIAGYEAILADPEGTLTDEARADYENKLALAIDEKTNRDKTLKAAQKVVSSIETEISEAENEIANAKNSYDYIGFGEARNYYCITIDKTGDYSFTLNRDLETRGYEYSNLYATIYKANYNGSGFSAVSSIYLGNTSASAVLNLNNLTAGEYYIEVNALEAAYGYTAKYNMSVNTLVIKDDNAVYAEKHNYTNAAAYAIGDKVELNANYLTSGSNLYNSDDDDLYHYYKFTTEGKSGKFIFDMDNTDATVSYSLYYATEGSVNLTYLALTPTYDAATQKYVYSAYLDADKQYYFAASTYSYAANEEKSYGFQITADSTLTKELTAEYTSDNDFANLTDGQNLHIGRNNSNTASFDSWVGYGDVNSWRKLTLDDGGNFKLTMENSDTNSDSYVTVTVYKMAASGTALTAVGSYAAYFSAGTETVSDFGYLLMEKGDYYIHVQNHSYYGNTEFTLTVDGADNANNPADDKCFIAKTDTDNAGNIYNDNTAFTDRNISVGEKVDGWVGYTDDYDYFNLTVDNQGTGYYNINFSNTDYAQVTLYVVNPVNSTLTYVNSCYRYSEDDGLAFSNQLLEKDSQYIVVVQSTNSYYGGNNDYSLSINKNDAISVDEFTIESGEEGWYTFKCSGVQAYSDFSLLQYYDTLGQAYGVGMSLTSNVSGAYEYTAYLGVGSYIVRSEDKPVNVATEDNVNKIITLA